MLSQAHRSLDYLGDKLAEATEELKRLINSSKEKGKKNKSEEKEAKLFSDHVGYDLVVLEANLYPGATLFMHVETYKENSEIIKDAWDAIEDLKDIPVSKEIEKKLYEIAGPSSSEINNSLNTEYFQSNALMSRKLYGTKVSLLEIVTNLQNQINYLEEHSNDYFEIYIPSEDEKRDSFSSDHKSLETKVHLDEGNEITIRTYNAQFNKSFFLKYTLEEHKDDDETYYYPQHVGEDKNRDKRTKFELKKTAEDKVDIVGLQEPGRELASLLEDTDFSAIEGGNVSIIYNKNNLQYLQDASRLLGLRGKERETAYINTAVFQHEKSGKKIVYLNLAIPYDQKKKNTIVMANLVKKTAKKIRQKFPNEWKNIKFFVGGDINNDGETLPVFKNPNKISQDLTTASKGYAFTPAPYNDGIVADSADILYEVDIATGKLIRTPLEYKSDICLNGYKGEIEKANIQKSKYFFRKEEKYFKQKLDIFKENQVVFFSNDNGKRYSVKFSSIFSSLDELVDSKKIELYQRLDGACKLKINDNFFDCNKQEDLLKVVKLFSSLSRIKLAKTIAKILLGILLISAVTLLCAYIMPVPAISQFFTTVLPGFFMHVLPILVSGMHGFALGSAITALALGISFAASTLQKLFHNIGNELVAGRHSDAYVARKIKVIFGQLSNEKGWAKAGLSFLVGLGMLFLIPLHLCASLVTAVLQTILTAGNSLFRELTFREDSWTRKMFGEIFELMLWVIDDLFRQTLGFENRSAFLSIIPGLINIAIGLASLVVIPLLSFFTAALRMVGINHTYQKLNGNLYTKSTNFNFRDGFAKETPQNVINLDK